MVSLWGRGGGGVDEVKEEVEEEEERGVGERVTKDGLCWEIIQENLSTVIVIFLRALDEAESIHITHITLPITSQQIKPANSLLEGTMNQCKVQEESSTHFES